jgi:hypothetical protein
VRLSIRIASWLSYWLVEVYAHEIMHANDGEERERLTAGDIVNATIEIHPWGRVVRVAFSITKATTVKRLAPSHKYKYSPSPPTASTSFFLPPCWNPATPPIHHQASVGAAHQWPQPCLAREAAVAAAGPAIFLIPTPLTAWLSSPYG